MSYKEKVGILKLVLLTYVYHDARFRKCKVWENYFVFQTSGRWFLGRL